MDTSIPVASFAWTEESATEAEHDKKKLVMPETSNMLIDA